MTHRPIDERFVRAAIKTGLKLQRKDSATGAGAMKSEGVAILRRIKNSLRNRNSNLKARL